MKRGGDTRCILAPRPPQLGSSQISGERKLGRGVPMDCVERGHDSCLPGRGRGISECGPLVFFLSRILNQFVIDGSSTNREILSQDVSSVL